MALIRNNAIRDDDVITPVGGIPGPAPAPKPVPPGDVILPVGGVPGPAPAPGPADPEDRILPVGGVPGPAPITPTPPAPVTPTPPAPVTPTPPTPTDTVPEPPVATDIPGPPAPPGTTPTPTEPTPGVGDIDYDVELVEDRLTGLLSRSSPYIKAARARAMEKANSRGLLNSSIAAGAGERAAIESAFPVASQDASAINQFGTQKYGQEATESLLGTESGYKAELSDQEFRQKKDLYKDQYEFEKQLKQMEFTSEEIRAIGSSTTLLGETLTNKVSDIQRDPTLSAGAKTTIISQLNHLYRNQLQSIASIYGVQIAWV